MSEQIENFERAFSIGTGGIRRTCACGVEYFDNSNNCYFDEGELEDLLKNPKAVALDYSLGNISFEGTEYVNGCTCWHKRAEQIIGFLDGHAHQIAEYLTLEKKRKQAIADQSPVVI